MSETLRFCVCALHSHCSFIPSPLWLKTGILPWMWWKCVWIFKGLLHLLCDHWVLFQFTNTASSDMMQLKISSKTKSQVPPTPTRRLRWGKECFCYMCRLKVIQRHDRGWKSKLDLTWRSLRRQKQRMWRRHSTQLHMLPESTGGAADCCLAGE